MYLRDVIDCHAYDPPPPPTTREGVGMGKARRALGGLGRLRERSKRKRKEGGRRKEEDYF